MATLLYLIRHGETEWNKERRIQGHSDIELNDRGKQQAEKLASYMERFDLSHVYASDLQRAVYTAQAVANRKNLSVRTVPALRERCYGEMEGLVYEEISEKFQGIKPDESLYGVESFLDMQKRAHEQLTSILLAHPGESIAIVSHGGVINSFLHWISEGKYGTGVTKIDNTGICLLQFEQEHGAWTILDINRVEHLQL